ncbi:MAG: CmpA/NrtA family ABC transporter substrate-binding protein [Pseudomonadota bacterium]
MIESAELPPAEKVAVNVGYLRLTDSAPFLIAREMGLFERMNLQVELRQEVSWANVRDKLVAGHLDAAQMLAPLPAMSTLGASGVRAAILTGLVLSNNGNAITLGQELWDQGQKLISAGQCETLLEVIRNYIFVKRRSLTFATVHAFSTHTILLRRWLKSGGIDPDQDVKIIVVPPVQMVDSLQAGIIDGYCVGEPWNTIAVNQGLGAVVAMGLEIWSGAPEKVLAVDAQWHRQHPNTHLRLRIALLQACAWLAQAKNVAKAAQILGKAENLDLPVESILPSLTGALRLHMTLPNQNIPDFHLFYGKEVNCPGQESAVALVEECAKLIGKPLSRSRLSALASQTFREDLYLDACREVNALGAHTVPQ